MPYNTFNVDGEYCNYKIDENGNRVGEALGCFDSAEDADEQLTAIRIEENSKSLYSSTPVDARFHVKEMDDGRLWWVATYSNNIRDRDNPPEILSGESHRRAVYMTDKGVVPYPELWVWHEKAWRIGTVKWLAVDTVDDIVFALAAGYVDEEAKEFVKAIANKDIALSHGMYPSSIERALEDKTIITGYIDHEISLLPTFAAANPHTGFVPQREQEKDKMAVNTEKREALEKEWPGATESLSEIEKQNKERGSAAKDLDLEVKESEETEQPEEGAETAKEAREEGDGEQTPEKEIAPTEGGLTAAELRDEVVDAIKALNERLGSIEDAIAANRETAEKQIAEVRSEVEQAKKREKQKNEAPIQSTLASLIQGKSAVGRKETSVPETDDMASGPEETEDTTGKGLFFEKFYS